MCTFGQTSVAVARMSSDDASSVLMCWWRLGHVSVKSRWCVVMVLWCLWWWVGDGSVLCRWCFFCFGDGVLIFWWTLMNILIGFLSKIQNSDLNLYILHLWANQCSCDPYVDGESFKIEKLVLSVVSWSCLRDVSVLVLRRLGDVSRCHGGVSGLFS